ncbi:DoxX family protein [Mycolicibacterium sp. BiH015]|uniref:DoxX family protein n=1 Tax=Mycolicibacterium sp. BiH015 TaxID=3018808 RepID=UPI0022E248AA|nr:DoxX family protein [Mycolicibacterium sp. BiH015]MDA2890559.1 DoxX family protein [Mycolicibacterium sp. BiH015]
MLIRRVARPMLSAVFISRGVEALRSPKPATDATRQTLEGLSKLPDPVGTNVPSNAETVAKVTAAVQIGGGLLLATGRLPRVASAALALSVVPSSLGGHAFWNEVDPQRKTDERRAFITDISLIGGLIIAAVDTEGKPSLGWRGRRAARKVSEAVASALPAGAAAGGSLTDSALAEKVGHGLHVGAERGRELAHVAGERGSEFAEVARDRGGKLAEIARERGGELAEIARERGSEWAGVARERSGEFAELARDRGGELAERARDRAPALAEVARDRSADWADVARSRAELALDRAADLADTAGKEAKRVSKEAKKQAKKQKRRVS